MAVNNNQTTEKSETAATTASGRRMKYGLNVTVLLLSVLVILIVLNWVMAEQRWRWDLTASRAYSLSPQTKTLLKSIDEPIEMTLLFSEQDAGPLRRQVEDVLREFQSETSHIEVARIDPTNAASAVEFGALLEHLKTIYADQIGEHEERIKQARAALEELISFSTAEGQWVASAALGETGVPTGDPSRRTFESIYVALASMPVNAQTLNDRVGEAITVGPGQPLADLEGAETVLDQALTRPAETLKQIVTLYQQAGAANSLPPVLADALLGKPAVYLEIADRMLSAAEQLRDLGPLELTPIVYSVRTGRCVLITDSSSATVIPFDTLFPPPSAREVLADQRLDLRFAGEGVIASALRRLVKPDHPTVVLCHAFNQPGRLRGSGNQPGLLTSLWFRMTDLGFELVEWNVASESRPTIDAEDGHTVWVILPPEPSMRDQSVMTGNATLAQAARELVESGENVLFSYWMSFIPGLGQSDPWTDVAESFGVRPDTGRVVFRQIPQAGKQDVNMPSLQLNQYTTDHLIGSALIGLDTTFYYPIPLVVENASTEDDDVHRWVVLEVEPSDRLWAEDQWFDPQAVEPTSPSDTEPYPLVVAADRSWSEGRQRVMFVGSGAWYYSTFVDEMQRIDSAICPINPGNAELFISGVYWLADLDEFIAPGVMTRTISRVDGLSDGMQLAYRWLLIAVLPLCALVVGVGVWFMRRG